MGGGASKVSSAMATQVAATARRAKMQNGYCTIFMHGYRCTDGREAATLPGAH